MTLGEFWQNEAEREGQGRSGGDVATDFWEEIDEDSRRCELELLADKAGLLSRLLAWDDFDGMEESDRIRFLDVVEIYDAVVRQGMRESGSTVWAKVATETRGEIFISYCEWSDAGSYLDPPDGGNECLILTLDKLMSRLRAKRGEVIK